MNRPCFRYQFVESVEPEEIELALVMALFGVEALHGEAAARLDARHAFDVMKRSCVIDAATPIGQDFNRLFLGFVRRELMSDEFTVMRIEVPVEESSVAA